MSRALLCVSLFISLIHSTAYAQNAVLAEFYGRGVHAFNSGDLTTAYDFLSKAIDAGSNDPRAFYFRGLTSIAAGREYEAEADYRMGAEIEAKGSFGPSIGQALSRVQGSNRIAIENMRQQARLEYQATAAMRSKSRYGDIQAAGAEVLRETPKPMAPVAPPTRRPAPPAVPPTAENPFAENNATGKPKLESKDVLEGAIKDPFADDVAPAASGKSAPAAGNDPFGDAPAAAGDDPFGGAAPAAGDAGADPFAN